MTHPSRIGQDRIVKKPWRVTMNGDDLFTPGTIFSKADIAGTLSVGGWPPGIIFRDLAETLDWWEVVEGGEHQVLVSLSGHGALKALGVTRLVQDATRGDSG